MSEDELAEYHLGVQAREIAEMSERIKPVDKELAGLTYKVFPKVYPGGIDSELTTIAIGDVSGKSVLDLCTGTGVVALHAARKGAKHVTAIDLNPEAVKNARFNAKHLGFSQIRVVEGSLFKPIGDERYDIIAINPPYTAKKPANKTEICFWDEKNQTTRSFFEQYKEHLNPGGRAFLAWADFSPIEIIEDFAKDNNVGLVEVIRKPTKSGLATFFVYELKSS